MKKLSKTGAVWIFCLTCLFPSFHNVSLAQCQEKLSESTKQKVHYHDIILSGKEEYLTFSGSGGEKIFSYHNEKIDLVYHVQMFTEVRFSSAKGQFSLYTTTSDRTRWQRCFTLSAPLTARELEKMKDAYKIEIILPEDHKVFSLDTRKGKELNDALACLFRINQM
ncbi:hypothetical protein [Dyadobacter sp. CY323]|uniref:hypothetical protein n=1 Tax=Dyadobacter sp. CY323 TaxID=2907302 RepID=UPI001F315FE9|nr:hypothetical protein [Dyadobacter sp. CY323]MCE6987923.1 hypothetical protein [Dyadobacter sp. CY323]